MKIKSKEGMAIFQEDSKKIQACLVVWKGKVDVSRSRENSRKEYWDSISSCSSF
jgi:hypothetical protein